VTTVSGSSHDATAINKVVNTSFKYRFFMISKIGF
jgi:hypothetical protein